MTKPRGIAQDEFDRIAISEDAEFLTIWDKCAPYTMTSFSRGLGLFRAIRHIVEARIPGCIVECGVWRGGSAMIALLTLHHFGVKREVHLFDTFSGMTAPTNVDVDYQGNSASELMQSDTSPEGVWAVASGQDVRNNLRSLNIDLGSVKYIAGDVCRTLPVTETGEIALLRLDTDFYDSTKTELDVLYPRVATNGVVIVDDYGHWEGARKAVDEYFSTLGRTKPFLQRLDYTGRLFIKPGSSSVEPNQRYDYSPEGLADPECLRYFPTAVVEEPGKSKWIHLRREVPHFWRVDSRSVAANIGLISIEEALILHNLALPFSGKRGLEVGCHLGWSTAHLLAAGLRLDVIDPRLTDDQHGRHVRESLSIAAPESEHYLFAGFSPSIVPAVRAREAAPWSFVFIDGNHDGDAPLMDAQAVIDHCDETACVVFHDLVAPAVAAGFLFFKEQGWNVKIYNTMQVLGVAWRGDFLPVEHQADLSTPEPAIAKVLLAE